MKVASSVFRNRWVRGGKVKLTYNRRYSDAQQKPVHGRSGVEKCQKFRYGKYGRSLFQVYFINWGAR